MIKKIFSHIKKRLKSINSFALVCFNQFIKLLIANSFCRGLYNAIARYPSCNISWGAEVTINSSLDHCTAIYKGTWFNGKLGYGSYINKHCNINGTIGRFSSIGPQCNVVRGRHPYTLPYVSTSPMFFSQMKKAGETFATYQTYKEYNWVDDRTPIIIEHDCWLGFHVTIIEGVTIHTGAIVLAGAVVTKDVPPYAIVGGVPAKVLGYRFNDETIRFLLASEWWNKDPQWLRKNWLAFNDMEKFKKLFNN